MAQQTPTRLHTREPEPAIRRAAIRPAARPGNRRQTDTTDSGGNPTTWQWLNTSFNEYYSIAGASLDCDANGNLISEPGVSTRTFRWDALNRLKDDGGSGAVVAYVYDADNRRVKKDLAAAGADVEYAYDGWLTLEEFDEGQSSLQRQYVHGRQMDELVLIDMNQNGDATASGTGDARYFYHQNLIHSVGALSGASGAIVEAYEYDPYGRHVLIRDGDSDGLVDFDATDARTVLGVSATGSPFTFTGRDYDPEIDKHHYRNRAYSWQAERFISRDPVGYRGGASLYGYVAGRATILVDPKGLYALTGGVSPVLPGLTPTPRPNPGPVQPIRTPVPITPSAKDCPKGCLKPNPDHKNPPFDPAKDWCGSNTTPEVPDYWDGYFNGQQYIVSFQRSCYDHDVCYGKCHASGKHKSSCDGAFGDNLKDACSKQLEEYFTDARSPAEFEAYQAAIASCLAWAGAYELAVRGFAGDAYWAGQDAACICTARQWK